MSTLIRPETVSEPVCVVVTDNSLSVDLADGRSISVPLECFPRLRHGTVEERRKYELSSVGIHWDDLNEDISIEGLLNGEKSGESAKSLQRWLAYRARGEKEPVTTLPLPDWAAKELKKSRSVAQPVNIKRGVRSGQSKNRKDM